MEYRRLGSSIIKVSELSFGTWENFGRVDFSVARDCMLAAYEAGVNSFDSADEYGGRGKAEMVMGKIMKELPRTDLIISSKCFWDYGPGPNESGLSRKHIMESVNASLKRFGTDYIDFYYCHRYEAEVIGQTDPNLEEVVRAMDDLVHQGKILYWGTSCWTAAQISQAVALCNLWNLYKPAMEQPLYNMFYREYVEKDLLKPAQKLGFGILTWSPTCNGILTGKYNDGIPADSRLGNSKMAWLGLDKDLTPENIEKVKKMTAVADDLGGTMAQLAIAWLLRLPEITSVIIGGTKLWHVQENLKAVELIKKLTPEALQQIEDILDNKPVFFTDETEKPDYD